MAIKPTTNIYKHPQIEFSHTYIQSVHWIINGCCSLCLLMVSRGAAHIGPGLPHPAVGGGKEGGWETLTFYAWEKDWPGRCSHSAPVSWFGWMTEPISGKPPCHMVPIHTECYLQPKLHSQSWNFLKDTNWWTRKCLKYITTVLFLAFFLYLRKISVGSWKKWNGLSCFSLDFW